MTDEHDDRRAMRRRGTGKYTLTNRTSRVDEVRRETSKDSVADEQDGRSFRTHCVQSESFAREFHPVSG